MNMKNYILKTINKNLKSVIMEHNAIIERTVWNRSVSESEADFNYKIENEA